MVPAQNLPKGALVERGPGTEPSQGALVERGPGTDSSQGALVERGPGTEPSQGALVERGPGTDSSQGALVERGPGTDSSQGALVERGPGTEPSQGALVERGQLQWILYSEEWMKECVFFMVLDFQTLLVVSCVMDAQILLIKLDPSYVRSSLCITSSSYAGRQRGGK
ncbi:hypothetical protein NDU88_013335 [Pleurodeles waltl]|uniref:Uncharacterized protein n=1 Tax=Pleurodeles waltl TaxID=8319 RepID=A0AAV7R8G1_PLEWA|nr:hypothetical protein NDU88_013335 [Pleurodeles waltl]